MITMLNWRLQNEPMGDIMVDLNLLRAELATVLS